MEADDDKTRTHVVLTKDTMVAHYRIVEKIGAGGMGEVYLAEDTKLKRQVALKFLPEEQTKSDAVLRQFTQEARAAARLQHPSIVTVHEINEGGRVPYIAMDYIEGQSLKELSSDKLLTVADIIDIGIQITKGLTAAHEKGVIHRDLKPGNLMIDASGAARILDFGLATLSDVESLNDSEATRTSDPFAGKVAGTISYMAPEQLLGQEINARADIFAFGVIMHELITGEHPFSAPTATEVSAGILRDTPTDLHSKRSNIPYDLNRIVSRCLAKKPDKRFQTARDVCNELEELSNELRRDTAITIIDQDPIAVGSVLCEESFVITTDLVRQLSHKDPKMIGGSLAYIDNGIASDALVFYLPPLGTDHEHYSDVLHQLPFRAIAISVFGFERNAQLRLPLTLRDHSILIHALIKDLYTRLRPRNTVLVGHSSGADHFLHLLTSELFSDIRATGVLALGCNVHIEDCFASGKLAELADGDESQILSTINLFSQMSSSLYNWLIIHDYLVKAFSKFGIKTAPLSQYASDIFAPFKDGSWEQFPKWYKYCRSRIRHTQFVIDTDGYPALDMLMQEHLENNILGDDFHEEAIVRAPCSHMELGQTEMVLKYTLEFMKLLEAK
ncbi:MAG: protein kinase [candidate division Zixibacteria bacterium]|nr:protein kinase [candidate division Zixibacteria bacterium]MDH3938834.1 protein kinase [candidate division Zixibacteria bacterium]MDH4035004.1 protein kinase [candidate division Zixibacteria bacterium]